MTYARIENGQVAEYPLYLGDIRLRFKNVSFVEPFTPPSEYAFVHDSAEIPTPTYKQNVIESTPIFVDGAWTKQWVLSDATPDQITDRIATRSRDIRVERDRRLAQTDWTQLADAPVNASAFAEYRQALRDLPQQPGFPWDVVWPQTP